MAITVHPGAPLDPTPLRADADAAVRLGDRIELALPSASSCWVWGLRCGFHAILPSRLQSIPIRIEAGLRCSDPRLAHSGKALQESLMAATLLT
jgi:hypothetical protein